MLAALADAGGALGRPDYVQSGASVRGVPARSAARRRGAPAAHLEGGRGRLAAYLEDHAFLLQGLLVLYEVTFEERWYREAVAIAEAMLARFPDPEHGGFFTTAADQAHLVTRRKDLDDAPIPSGNSAAALGLLRLAHLSGEVRYERAAIGVLRLHWPIAARHPTAFGHLLQALDFYLARVREVAIAGRCDGADADGAGPLAGAVRARFRPHEVLAGGRARERRCRSLLEGRGPVDGRAAASVRRFACETPVTMSELLAALSG